MKRVRKSRALFGKPLVLGGCERDLTAENQFKTLLFIEREGHVRLSHPLGLFVEGNAVCPGATERETENNEGHEGDFHFAYRLDQWEAR